MADETAHTTAHSTTDTTTHTPAKGKGAKASEESEPESDFEVGGEEENFLPSGQPVSVAEDAAKEKAEHDAAYFAQQQQSPPPEVAPTAEPEPVESEKK